MQVVEHVGVGGQAVNYLEHSVATSGGRDLTVDRDPSHRHHHDFEALFMEPRVCDQRFVEVAHQVRVVAHGGVVHQSHLDEIESWSERMAVTDTGRSIDSAKWSRLRTRLDSCVHGTRGIPSRGRCWR